MGGDFLGTGPGWLDGEPPRRREKREPAKKIPHPRVQCPACTSYDVKLQSTQKPVRYYTCNGCRWKFQTVDHGPELPSEDAKGVEE